MFPKTRDLTDDIHRWFADLDRDDSSSAWLTTTECEPPLDVVETPSGVEILVDLPGVAPESIRVVVKSATILILGRKTAVCLHGEARFHLAERAFGRFARAVRLSGAFDLSHVEATLHAGELRLSVSRIDDRRGRAIVVPIRRQPEP